MPKQTRRFLTWTCLLMLACLWPLHVLGVDIIAETAKSRVEYLSVVLAGLAALRLLKRGPLVQLLLEVTAWSMLVSTLVGLPVALMVRLPVPFVDQRVRAVDSHLGFDAAAVVEFVRHHPRMDVLCNLAYISLRPADIITLYVPILCRRPRWLSELFVALVLQLAATVLIMAFAQAIGPWVVNGVTASERQTEISDLMVLFKHAPRISLDMGDIPGFVAFPSWHVMLAMLCASTLSRIRLLREVSIVWVVLVAISTVTTGWHYGTDVLAGLVIGSLSIVGSRYLHRLWNVQPDRLVSFSSSGVPAEGAVRT